MVLKGHKRSVWDVSFNKLEKLLASAAADGTVKVWNLVTGECLSTMGEGPALLRVQWLYHNQVVTGSLDGIVRIWDIRKLTSCSFDKHEGKIWSLDVSAMD
jgi:U3 small nucleolar RNA-associated protein 13